MTYECAFDFTVCNPKKSNFIGKNGIIELTTENPLTDNEIKSLKKDKELQESIAYHLNKEMKQKIVFMVKVTSVSPKQTNK